MKEYKVRYFMNGFWFGQFKRGDMEAAINAEAAHGWRVVAMTYAPSIWFIFFPRRGVAVTFERDNGRI